MVYTVSNAYVYWEVKELSVLQDVNLHRQFGATTALCRTYIYVLRNEVVNATDVDRRSQNLRHLYSGMGLKLGYLGFSMIKIIMIRLVRMYCSLSVKIDTRETSNGSQRSWTHFVCICFCVCGRLKPEFPHLELHGWRRHYTEQYRSLGSPFYISVG